MVHEIRRKVGLKFFLFGIGKGIRWTPFLRLTIRQRLTNDFGPRNNGSSSVVVVTAGGLFLSFIRVTHTGGGGGGG